MKEKRILNLLGQVNDDYIAEAAPPKSSKSKHHGVKWGIVAACLCLVLAGVLQLGRKPTLSLSLVMTAYAADGTGYELGETPVALLDDMEIGSGSYATYDEGTGHGRSSSLFHIICENENIDTITYTINNEVNAANMAELSQNNAWFATQTITPSPVNDEFPVYATRRSSNGTHAYSYVGNSYTVNYGNQDSTEMYLEYRIDNVNGQWTAKVINITVNVKFKDGSIAEKKLLIQPTYDDSIRELCISVLSEDTEALAEKYLQSAFSFDAKECSPIITQEDDKVHRIRPHVLHLMRGQIFELEGCRFFTMGGAKSHDIEDGILEPDTSDFERRLTMLQRKPRARYRINHISWWAQELPSDEEYTEARRNLDAVGWQVDYIITHCAPTSIALTGSRHNEADRLTDFLQEVRERAKYHYWLFGHYHDNKAVDEKHILLWEQIVQIC